MADTSTSAIMTKRQPETGSSFGGTFPEVGAISGPLPTGGVIRNFQEPTRVPETDLGSQDPRTFIQKEAARTSLDKLRDAAAQAMHDPLQK